MVGGARPLFLLTCGFLAVVLSGCRNNYEMPPAPPPPPNVVSPDLQIRLDMTPQPVRQMDQTTFTVRLTDAHARPVTGASVTADLVMPAMDMGRNAVAADAAGAGRLCGGGAVPDGRRLAGDRDGDERARSAPCRPFPSKSADPSCRA